MLMSVLCVLAVLAIGPGQSQPCVNRVPIGQYNTFIDRHVLDFPRNTNKQEWKRFLVSRRLCGRFPTQTFIASSREDVNNVCRGGGRRYSENTNENLCVSTKMFPVYTVRSSNRLNVCLVTSVNHIQSYITLGCDNIDNHCRPDHLQSTTNQPNPANPPCQ